MWRQAKEQVDLLLSAPWSPSLSASLRDWLTVAEERIKEVPGSPLAGPWASLADRIRARLASMRSWRADPPETSFDW